VVAVERRRGESAVAGGVVGSAGRGSVGLPGGSDWRPVEFPMISADLCWRFSGAVRKNDNRRTRTHAPSGVNLNTSVNMPAAERPRGGKPRGLTL
jgi:hypothetical protein